MPNDHPALVTTGWLAANLGRPDVKVVDASWYLPTSGRDAAAEFAESRIPGAVFYDPSWPYAGRSNPTAQASAKPDRKHQHQNAASKPTRK